MFGKFRMAMLAIGAGSMLWGAAASAAAGAPMETPPGTFGGAEFVDSAGCAFVRAELGGEVVWVPRVTRNHVPVCGLTPSIADKPRPAAAVQPDAEPLPPAKPEAIAGKEVPAAEVTKTDVRAATPSPAPAARSTSRAPAAKPRKGGVQMVKVTCSARSGQRWSYIAPYGAPLRCNTPPTAAVASEKPVYQLPALPAGYKYAFGEARHNPNRGERTATGTEAMNRIWTETVPRKLIRPGDRGGLVLK